MTFDEVKICIGYPSGEFLHHKFVDSLFRLVFDNLSKFKIAVVNSVSSRITHNRNELVENAQKSKATHLLFIDADMTVPSNCIERLLAHDKDIACATACRRKEGDSSPMGTLVDETESSVGLVRMKSVGLPLMLVKMEVFDKLKKPYFAEPPTLDGQLIAEDAFFCYLLEEAGLEIWCDMDLSAELGHMGTKEYKISATKLMPIQSVKIKEAA